MKHYILPAAFVAALVVIIAAIVPMWTMTAGVSLPASAIGLIVLMIVGCFAVGGGLMFLIFYSARKGYDDQVHHGVGWRDPPDQN
jgi:uncharacterized membrane-anchored protein